MQRIIKAGHAADAGLIFHVFAMDSTLTTGVGKASVAFGSWTCRYIRAGGAISGAITPEDITTIGTYAAPTANTNIRIKAVDNTNMIGVYELQLHLDWVATGSEALTIFLTASGVAPVVLTIPLTLLNVQESLNNLSAANVNAEVADVMKTDTIADRSQGTPPATPTFEQAVMYLYSALRNEGRADKTASEKKFYNNAGVLIWKKAITKTSTLYTEAEGVSGP